MLSRPFRMPPPENAMPLIDRLGTLGEVSYTYSARVYEAILTQHKVDHANDFSGSSKAGRFLWWPVPIHTWSLL